MLKDLILLTPYQPSNISKVSLYYCIYTHPCMDSFDVIIFHFMNTHLPIEHIQSVTLALFSYFGWFMGLVMDGGGVVGGFMGWVGGGVSGWRVYGVGWCVMVWVVVGGWLEGSWGGWWLDGWLEVHGVAGGQRVNGVGAHTHPPMNS